MIDQDDRIWAAGTTALDVLIPQNETDTIATGADAQRHAFTVVRIAVSAIGVLLQRNT